MTKRSDGVAAFPLRWPDGWPRTPADERASGRQFKSGDPYERDASAPDGRRWVGKRDITPDRARRMLAEQLGLLGATGVVLSTNVPLRADGELRADAARYRISDTGAAIYFTLDGRQMVMAQDAFETVAANVRSLGLAVEAMRALRRHGGGALAGRAFAGFAALPPPITAGPPEASWREVLGFDAGADVNADQVKLRYRFLATQIADDASKGDADMARLNVARDAALAELGG